MDETTNVTTEQPTVERNYIDIIKGLKESTVSKAEYNRVVAENKTLAEAFATSAPASTEEVHEPTYSQDDIDKLAQRMSKGHMSNLDFINSALAYREACIAVNGKDPFLPNNNGYVINDADVARAEAIADGLKTMAAYANGDAKLFNSELKRCCR